MLKGPNVLSSSDIPFIEGLSEDEFQSIFPRWNKEAILKNLRYLATKLLPDPAEGVRLSSVFPLSSLRNAKTSFLVFQFCYATVEELKSAVLIWKNRLKTFEGLGLVGVGKCEVELSQLALLPQSITITYLHI